MISTILTVLDIPRLMIFAQTTYFESILDHQCNIKGNETYGGFYSGNAWFFGEEANNAGKHVNSWVTMFILQALNMYVDKTKFDKDMIFYLVQAL